MSKEKKERKSFLAGVIRESKKLVPPTGKELKNYTIVTVATCTFFAVSFWLIDTGILAGLKLLIK